MINRMNKLIGLLCFWGIVIFFSTSCGKDELIVDGVAPIYVSATDFSIVKSESPREYQDLGNILSLGDYILINEKGKGIHVIDNTVPSTPIDIYFWNIPGNSEFTIKGDILYADNSVHLLAIDISDFSDIHVLNYTPDIFLDLDVPNPRPIGYVGYFYCVKKENGIHIGWTDTIELIDPLCEAF